MMAKKEVEIIQVNKREIRVGENTLYLGENNIIYVTPVGKQGEEKAVKNREAVLKFADMVEGKVSIVADLNSIGKPSHETRRIGTELFNSEKIDKVAFFGLHPVARVVASFLMGISRRKSMRFFGTKEESIAWIEK